MLERFGLADRRRDRVETLSGGLRRRVELAKGLLHRPQLLLLDEPSTGLDPAARSDMWEYLRELRSGDGVTIVLTTHLLEEADKADRIAILDRGQLVALDTPDALRATVGGDAITIETASADQLAASIQQRFNCEAKVMEGNVAWKCPTAINGLPNWSKRSPARSTRSHSASRRWKMYSSIARGTGWRQRKLFPRLAVAINR